MQLNLNKEYDINRGFIIPMLAGFCGDVELATDTYSEIYFKVARKSGGDFNDRNGFRAWLFHVGRNLIRDHWRKKDTKNIFYTDVYFDYSVAVDNPIEDNIITDEFLEYSKKLLHKLPEEQRSTFKRAYMQRQGYQNVAEDDGVSINTVLGRVRYAKINLKKLHSEIQQ